MNIGIDISQIVYAGTGVARFTDGLVKAVCKYDKTNQWTFFFSSLRQKLPNEIKSCINKQGGKIIQYTLPPTLLSIIWNDLHLYDVENIAPNLDWFITSDWTEPPAKKTKKATIVHDLVYLRYPETVDSKILKVQQKRLQLVKKESNLIISDSICTKNDLIELLKIPENKIKVIYPGVEINSSTIDKEQIISKFGLHQPYILTVGKSEPRKNIKRLISAFQQINHPEIDLVIVGPKGWDDLNIKGEQIHCLGFVNDQELATLYQNCLFFTLPSIWEGFGYPVIEAMQAGAPVTCSNTSSIKEIAGNAALTFNPLQISDIKSALQMMIDDQPLRTRLISMGKKQQQLFNWENYYNELITTLKKN